MALDRVRTQVLILHSEQSALDSLSAGFDDRYTVHCATSGTEALNTLGDTPVHVIISAKDLPGMSGVEALREAKKRSPETIGILLAGDNDKGLEALVGEKEVFQVVTGAVKPQDLTKLVDNATRQMRLMALAESANDTAANPDEPAEHIVMETSENGSTIISDGTGTMPVLDPQKIASAVAAGSASVDVLVVTKDEEFLATVKESTRGMHHVHAANTLALAEKALGESKVGVAVVDAAMVGENVEKLTQHLRRKKARLVNIVAGRRDDGEMLMDLINRGKVYRFLLKPVSPGRARLAIEASVKHHLEAPESAFQISGAEPAAAKPAPRPAAKAPAPKKPAVKAAPPSKPAKPAPPVDATPSPNTDSLSTAFDGDDSSFTETMTGIVTNLGKALTKKKDKPAEPEAPATRARKEPVIGPSAPAKASPAPEPSPSSLDIEPAGDSGGSLLGNPKLIGAAAALLLASAAAGWFLLGGSPEEPTRRAEPVADKSPAERPATPPPEAQDAEPALPGDDVAAEARLARNAGQIINPPGSNAVELFARAVADNPGNAALADEFGAVLNDALRIAETALLERRATDAATALDRVAFADPGNGRLPFLYAQLSQLQLRGYLDEARLAIRESRFEDAARSLAMARDLDVGDVTEINAVANELAASRSQQRVDELLVRAAERVEQQQLIEPPNDNARYYFELVLSSEPDNLVAQQGLTAIASKLVLQARAQIDQGRFGSAGALLAEAERLDPNSAELAEAAGALSDARDRAAADQRRLEAERLAAAEREEQQRNAAAELAAELAAAERSTAEAVQDAAAPIQQVASATPQSASAGDDAATPPAEYAAAESGASNDPIAMSMLTRVKYVAPKYPRAAERRNLSGWVDVVFTVAADGTTADIEVRNSEPGDIFVNAAIRAVERWEFEPIVENGRVVTKQAGVRLMFALE